VFSLSNSIFYSRIALLLLLVTVASSGAHQHGHKNEVSFVFIEKLFQQYGHQPFNALSAAEFENLVKQMNLSHLLKDQSVSCSKMSEVVMKDVAEINQEKMLSICPILLYHMVNQSESCLSTSLFQDNHSHSHDAEKESSSKVWIYSTLSLLTISLCGLLSVAVIPIMEKYFYKHIIQYLIAMAVGTLTGDALIHLLPHAMTPTNGEASHDIIMYRGIATMLAIMSFYFVERLLTIFTSMRQGSPKRLPTDEMLNAKELMTLNNAENQIKQESSHGHSHSLSGSSLSAVVWMVIFGDGLHKCSDGMTIGAAFSTGIAGGLSTAVAVFCHELPHVLGDFAVLLKAGMSMKQAIFYNLLSSVLGFLGMCVGIVIGDTPEASQWIFAVAAGLFIYIALVDMVRKIY